MDDLVRVRFWVAAPDPTGAQVTTVATDEDAMALHQLSYVSRPVPGTTVEDLDALVARAQRHNATQSVTGLLGFRTDLFCQVLEGERAVLSDLFLRIAADRRHVDVQLVGFEEVERRRFASWAMGYVRLDGLASGEGWGRRTGDGADLRTLAHGDLVEALSGTTSVLTVEGAPESAGAV